MTPSEQEVFHTVSLLTVATRVDAPAIFVILKSHFAWQARLERVCGQVGGTCSVTLQNRVLDWRELGYGVKGKTKRLL